MNDADRGLCELLLDDGHALLSISALGLLAAGLFAWFLAITGQLLPHDLAWLTISERELRALADGRVVHFMSHDRAAFGGTLVAVAVMYLWLVRIPLRAGESWAWWVLLFSGGVGFVSFATYLGTGYFDSWHALATLAILGPFAAGLIVVRRRHAAARQRTRWDWRQVLQPASGVPWSSGAGIGRLLLMFTGLGLISSGAIIATIGSLVVFVPQDVDYIGLSRAQLDAIDPRLVPLIAHDRAGFGGGLASVGLAIVGCVWCARPSESLWQALGVAGLAGFGSAIGTHVHVGYLDLVHVGPAALAALVFGVAMVLARPRSTIARAVRGRRSGHRIRACIANLR